MLSQKFSLKKIQQQLRNTIHLINFLTFLNETEFPGIFLVFKSSHKNLSIFVAKILTKMNTKRAELITLIQEMMERK
jgi:hypothetical protein